MQCTVGFSGVLFGLKTVLNWTTPSVESVQGITLPSKVLAACCSQP